MKDGEIFIIPLVCEYIRNDRALDGWATDSEYFMSDSESSERASVSSEIKEEEFVMMITDNAQTRIHQRRSS